jgi:hypothetical protein
VTNEQRTLLSWLETVLRDTDYRQLIAVEGMPVTLAGWSCGKPS